MKVSSIPFFNVSFSYKNTFSYEQKESDIICTLTFFCTLVVPIITFSLRTLNCICFLLVCYRLYVYLYTIKLRFCDKQVDNNWQVCFVTSILPNCQNMATESQSHLKNYGERRTHHSLRMQWHRHVCQQTKSIEIL